MEYAAVMMQERAGKLQVLLGLRFDSLDQFREQWEVSGPLVPLRQRGTLAPILGQSGARNGNWMPVDAIEELQEPWGAILCEALAHLWPLLPLSHEALTARHTVYPELRDARHLTFYGGTFHPLHRGHLACIRLCPARPLVVMPDHNPLKKWPGEYSFWGLYRELQREVVREGIYVYPGFCGQQRPNPTIDWLRQLTVKKSLLLGDDCFRDLHLWQDFEQLLQILHGIYVVPRGLDDDDFQRYRDQLWTYNPRLKIERLPHHAHEHISSSGL